MQRQNLPDFLRFLGASAANPLRFGRFRPNTPSLRAVDSTAARQAGIVGLAARLEKEMTMNKQELVEHVAAETECSKAAAAAAIDAVLSGITDALKKGDEVRLVGFGTFSVKERAAGTGRNPATGEEIKIPASKSARFKPGATLKTALNNEK